MRKGSHTRGNRAHRRRQRTPWAGRSRLYGAFVEHLGRAVYGGIYEPGHPTADEMGFRGDVLEMVRELGVPFVRYPGGNFVSGYDWRDGVGPVRATAAARSRLDVDRDERGRDQRVRRLGESGRGRSQPRRQPGHRRHRRGARSRRVPQPPRRQLLERPAAFHGVSEPHGVETWCLGNEMDALAASATRRPMSMAVSPARPPSP